MFFESSFYMAGILGYYITQIPSECMEMKTFGSQSEAEWNKAWCKALPTPFLSPLLCLGCLLHLLSKLSKDISENINTLSLSADSKAQK